MQQKNKTVIPQTNDPIIIEFYKFVSPIIAKWLGAQYTISLDRPYNHILIENTNSLTVSISNKIYTVTDYNMNSPKCSCYDHLSLDLPCRHIFFSRKVTNNNIFLSSMVNSRHLITTTLNKILCDDQDSLVTKIPNLNHVDSLLTSKNMDQKSKYNAAF
jgi:hypothetical protein